MNPAVTHPARLSVVVPVLRDADALQTLVADLRRQTQPPDDIVVVSGEHDTEVMDVAGNNGLRLLHTPASRGLQLDTGARAVRSGIVWFLHADARLPDNACAAIAAAVRDGAAGGCLRFRFQGARGALQRSIEWLVRMRIACGGIAYGDQGLFVTQTAYAASGGFAHSPLFEEVPLVRYLRSQRRFAALSVPVLVATRRWERDGWIRRSLHNRWLALRHSFGASATSLAKAYRSGATAGAPARRRDGVAGTRG